MSVSSLFHFPIHKSWEMYNKNLTFPPSRKQQLYIEI